MPEAAWNLDGRRRCCECGVGVPLAEFLQGTHICDPGDRLAQEAVVLAEQIELMHVEISLFLRSGEGRRQAEFARWCREHPR